MFFIRKLRRSKLPLMWLCFLMVNAILFYKSVKKNKQVISTPFSIVIFSDETFDREMSDYYKRVEIFTKVTLPSVPPEFLTTRKMKTNFTFSGFDKLEMIKNMVANHETLNITGNNLFINYDIHDEPVYTLNQDTREYFQTFGNVTCFTEGTVRVTRGQCKCREKWFGPWCSFPEIMNHTSYNVIKDRILDKVRPRSMPRRMLNLLTFNVELETFEIRLGELGDVVDAFVVMESNITGYGDPKPLYLLGMLRRGFLESYHKKIFYQYYDKFSNRAYYNGWLAEAESRDVLGLVTISSRIQGLQDDDVIFYTDADEIPKREVLLFLKLHDGYPQDIGINYSKRTYGFFWRDPPNKAHKWYSAVTMGFLRDVYNNHTFYLRNPIVGKQYQKQELLKYGHKYYHKQWSIGFGPHFAGWHCSYCFNAETILIKLQSVINEDYPRWGDHPENFDLNRIKNFIIGQGYWFDNKTKFEAINMTIKDFVPKYVLEHKNKFRHLLVNEYSDQNV